MFENNDNYNALIIRGEKIQQLADIYVANTKEDILYNWKLLHSEQERAKCYLIRDMYLLTDKIVRPCRIFCYGHCLREFSKQIHHIQQPFLLLSHNSDENMNDGTSYVSTIRECPFLVGWFSQNVSVTSYHTKGPYPLPIGIANSMWDHGNVSFVTPPHLKKNSIYFQFNVKTNVSVREPCFNILHNHIEWLPSLPPQENIERLKTYKMCICPEGNGYDTHRIWEALLCKTVPICLRTFFIENITTFYNLPILMVDSWDDIIHKRKEIEEKADELLLQQWNIPTMESLLCLFLFFI